MMIRRSVGIDALFLQYWVQHFIGQRIARLLGSLELIKTYKKVFAYGLSLVHGQSFSSRSASHLYDSQKKSYFLGLS